MEKIRELVQRFRKFATRFLFILVGIPLIGGLYTSALDIMADSWGLSTRDTCCKSNFSFYFC